MKTSSAYSMVARYLAAIILGLNGLFVFYFIFTPLTVRPVFFIISLFDNGARLLEGNLLFYSGVYAEIIPACVAGAAYYLLTLLNLTTPMRPKKRFLNLGFLLGSFLVLNILRIVFFASLSVRGDDFFDAAHLATWYIGSTVLVAALWFAGIWLFSIKEIPMYSDIRGLLKDVFRKRRK